ncbi:HD domain-containing protein [Pseudomonas sp. P66]|uniref:HD domain-containing protein n=1 Tax=Pseudomonas arcuscaelestis TaxID=2710591 RepID=A0ABS2BZ30_9PSED|nr:HD domain-containing protein [Pseudomonas arcuscaelestis]MBM5458880.1 HD domain-containing protein [Pseudomonas arcuscaelestis]
MDSRLQIAQDLATEWHMGEVRKYTDGEPYIIHPIAVAQIVASVTDRWEEIAAAYLHDVLECAEDLRAGREEVILVRLGSEVLNLVLEVTNPSRPSDGPRDVRKAIDREHLAKASPAGQTLRLADAIHNFSNLEERNPRFALTYAQEKVLILPLTLQGSQQLHARLTEMLMPLTFRRD